MGRRPMIDMSRTTDSLLADVASLSAQLDDALDMLRAIRAGEIDALVVDGSNGPRVYTLQGLEAASNQFRGEILSQVKDVVITLDPANRVTFLNRAAELQYGVTAADALGHHRSKLFEVEWSGDDEERRAEAALAADGNWSGENVHVTITGQRLYAESSMTALGGDPGGTLVIIRDVSARKRAEHALRASELAFRTMIDAIPQLAWRARPDGYVYYFNQNWYSYTGAIPEEVVGSGWQRVYAPDRCAEVISAWNFSIASGTPFQVSLPLRGVDGAFRTFLTRAVPLKDDSGRVIQWFGTSTDIEDLSAAQKALTQSEQRLRMALDGAGQGTFHYDSVQDVLSCDERTRHLYDADIGQNRFKLEDMLTRVHPNDRRSVSRVIADTLRGNGNRSSQFEHRVHTSDGALRWLAVHGQTEFAGENSSLFPIYTDGTVRDITVQKVAQDNIAAQLEEIEAVYENTPVGLALLSKERRFLKVNQALAAMSGIEPQGHLGLDFSEVPGPLKSAIGPHIDRVFRTGEIIDVEVSGEAMSEPGRMRYWRNRIYPLKHGNGQIGKIGITVDDITENKEHEEQILLLMREVNHRSKNLLGVVQAIARHTARMGYRRLRGAVLEPHSGLSG